MLACFRNQTYPKERIIQWIILDDGTDKIGSLLPMDELPMIEYHAIEKKLPLGKKRNMMHDLAKGDIIVYMDDDDYYPPERIQHSVETLMANPQALCAGSSEIYCYFKHIGQMIQFGPYGPNHATAGTFAFRRELLSKTRYEETACLAEEKFFLKDYTIPFVQLDPRKTILVFSHDHNTFDKKKLLDSKGPNNPFIKETKWTVDDFICQSFEGPIRKFFMEDIDIMLARYEPGIPAYKPDVIEQTKELEKKRMEMNTTPINIIDPATGQKTFLSMEQVINLIRQMETELNNKQNVIMQQRQYIDQQAEFIRFLESKT
jgi:glycosyltransferase involved in cell wall biosynthesis